MPHCHMLVPLLLPDVSSLSRVDPPPPHPLYKHLPSALPDYVFIPPSLSLYFFFKQEAQKKKKTLVTLNKFLYSAKKLTVRTMEQLKKLTGLITVSKCKVD